MSSLDPERLGELFEAHAPALVLYARTWLDRSSAEEAVQDAFVKLMVVRPAPRDPRAWLYGVVRHAAIDRARRRRPGPEAAADPWFAPARAGDPAGIERALRMIPGPEREVLILRVWAGLTLEQIGRVLRLSTSTVHRMHQRALDIAEAALEEPCKTE